MNQKLLSALAVAVIVLGLLSWITSRSRYSPVEGGGFEELTAEPIEKGKVQSIRAWLGSAPDSAVALERSGDGWVVSSSWGWPAKASLVDQLLDDLSGLKGEKRSSSADILADYQIDEENGVHVVGTGTGGSELFHLVVGKTATRGGSFVRRHDSNDVFLAGASLRSSFGVWGDEPKPPEPKRWLELRVHNAERLDVDRIVLHDGSKEISLEKSFEVTSDDSTGVAAPDRSQWTWKDDASGPIDKGKADGILGTVCNLYASDTVPPSEDADAYGLANPARSLDVYFEDGRVVTLAFGNNADEDKKTYARLGEDGLPALIYKSTVDRLFPDRDELKPAKE